MPTKARRSPNKKQVPKAKSRHLGKRDSARAKSLKQREKALKARERDLKRREKDYRRKMRQLQKIGAYAPASKKATKARKAYVNKRYRKFQELLQSDAYIFVPIPTRSKRKRDRAIKLAKQNQYATAPKGVFIPKTKHTKSAKAVYSKRTGTYRIKIKKVKTGPTGKKTITEIMPIEPLTSIEDELERIKEDAAELEPDDDEALAYRVTLNEEGGFSWRIFQKPEQLVSYLSQGVSSANRGTPANKLQVYRSVSVMKVRRENYFQEHPRPDRNPYFNTKIDRKGRSVITRNPARSKFMTPWEQGYAAYNSGFAMNDNPYPFPPERRQWENGYLQAKKDDGK